MCEDEYMTVCHHVFFRVGCYGKDLAHIWPVAAWCCSRCRTGCFQKGKCGLIRCLRHNFTPGIAQLSEYLCARRLMACSVPPANTIKASHISPRSGALGPPSTPVCTLSRQHQGLYNLHMVFIS